MSLARIVSRFRMILSSDLDQLEKITDTTLNLDDTTATKALMQHLTLTAGGAYVTVTLPSGMSRISFLHVESDAPILVRLNGAGDIPVTALATPALSIGNPVAGPSVLPTVQKGMLVLRSGVSNDGNTVYLTSVEVRCPGSTAAAVKVTIAGE